MTSNDVYAHVPYALIRHHLDFIVERRINPEIAFNSDSLETAVRSELVSIAETLASNNLKATIHSPFMDLNPGAVDPLVWEATFCRFNQVFDVAEIIRPTIIVFHPGYDRWRFGDKRRQWLDNSIKIWEKMLVRSEKTGSVIAVENIFEEEPSTLRELFEQIDSPMFRHCFDTGHFNLFSRVSMEEWFAEVGGYIAETHIHDNNGTKDDHLPIGEGNIDFGRLFGLLNRYAPGSAYTIEAHSRENLERAMKNLSAFL
ncbi:MAG TPA: sugar phosphate isomerase/epimerase family protein [Geobacteraceae bacterium]|nr:sugar phosphate isomerase/epimerase family protein [Geobacteraceae bacterium]